MDLWKQRIINLIILTQITRTLTSNLKNTAVSDSSIYGIMSDKLRPVEDMMKVLKAPINLAASSRVNRQSDSINIAAGTRISVAGGHVLTVKPQGVEVFGGTMNLRNAFNNLGSGDEIFFGITEELLETNDFMPQAGDTVVDCEADSVSADEALYKPSAYEHEIYPSHKLRLYSGYFALAGSCRPTTGMSS